MKKGEIKEKKRAVEMKKRWNIRNIPEIFCNAGVYIFLFFLVVIYVFYAPEGYIQIATHKYRFFRKMVTITGAAMIPFVTLHYIMLPFEKHSKKIKWSVSLTDVFVFLFLIVNVISFFFTEYRDEACWGTSGWYMGFAMHVSFVGIYFVLSRFYDGKIDLLPFFMVAVSVVFLWGLLNRFSVYPIDMNYDDISFISSIGNINWFCGFWSVFFVIGVVMYIIAEKRSLRILSAAYSILALGLGVVEGSDSAFISMGVVFFFLFIISFQKTVYMKRLLDEGIFYCGACQIMRVIASFALGDSGSEQTGWGGLNFTSSMTKLMLGNLTLAVLVIVFLLRIVLGRKDKKYMEISMAQERLPEPQLIRKFIWLRNTVIGLIAAVAAVYLILLIVNTRTPGILGPLSKYPVLLFDGHWGSSRGRTWRDGLLIYQTLSWRERLFGVGPDCFSVYAYSVPEVEVALREHWGNSRLTNAHNECITYLVNLGIFGMLSFIGIYWSSFKRLVEKAAKEPVCYVFAASVLSYFFHNQFSFSQVTNIPFIFMMLGLGESLMRRIDLENDQQMTV